MRNEHVRMCVEKEHGKALWDKIQKAKGPITIRGTLFERANPARQIIKSSEGDQAIRGGRDLRCAKINWSMVDQQR